MIKISRRVLARWAADQLLAGKSASAISSQLVAVLTEQKMQGQARQLADDINFELEHRQELAMAKATSARELPATATADVERAIKQATGVKHVVLETEVDKSLIGGLRVETAERIWDESLQTKLANLRGVA